MSASNEKEQKEKVNKKDKNNSSVVTKESLSAVCALFSALALLMLFTGGLIFGTVGTGVTEVLLGAFGYFAYPVFIAIFYLSFTSFFDIRLVKNRKVGTLIAVIVFCIALIVHTSLTAFQWSPEEYLANCFTAGGSFATSTVCGIVGGLLVWALYSLISPVGAILVFSGVTLFCLYLLFLATKKTFAEKKSKGLLEKTEEKMPEVENNPPQNAYPQEVAYSTQTSPYGQPYIAPRPAVNLSSQSQDGWSRQASYSPFAGEASLTPSVDRPLTREESKAFLFADSPADTYNKNLFFDKSANVNLRWGKEQSTGANAPASPAPTPSYTQSYEDSFRTTENTPPKKIVTDYTSPAPSYTHPSLSDNRREGLLRDTGLIQEEEKAQEGTRETFTERGRDLDESTYRISDSVEFGRGSSEVDFGRTRGEDFSRSSRDAFSVTEERSGRASRDLFDDDSSGTEVTFEVSRGTDSQSGTFVSPFAERDFQDDSSDFMTKKEDDFAERDTFTIPKAVEEKPVSRISETRSTRFVDVVSKPIEPKEEVAPVVEKPKYIRPYTAPPLHYFDCTEVKPDCNQQEVEWNKQMILDTLEGFGIKEATISSVTYGPTVTRYNIVTPINVSSKKILGLSEQFAVNLHAENGVNVSFNYGDGATSIEVPNRKRQFVHLGCMLTGAGYVSAKPNSLTFALGVDVSNEKVYGDVAKMTHLLVAGASGMGKSAFLRSLIISLIYKYSPQDLRLILIDPKMADFTLYTGIPHLVINEIICRPQQAVQSLRWAIGEMERRYELFRKKSLAGTYVVNVDGYNANLSQGEEKLPKIVIIVDELADLMSVAKKDVEDCIQRLTAKARAAGIHMILATQRPSVDVVTGVIKSNLPTRIAFAVASDTDSRVILDASGADKLLSMGDMMYSMAGFKNPVRVQAPYIDDSPAQAVINYIRENNDTDFNSEAMAYINNASAPTGTAVGVSSGGEVEPVYIDALKYVIQTGNASISMIQRKLSVGFNKAGRIIEWMEANNYIAEFDGSSKPRKALITKEEFEEKFGEF